MLRSVVLEGTAARERRRATMTPGHSVVPVFDASLNATFCPSPTPRDSVVALWATPENLMGTVPATVGPTDSLLTVHGPAPDVLEFSGSSEMVAVVLPCWKVPMAQILDSGLLPLHPHDVESASRSLRQLSQVVVCALEMIERGLLHVDMTDSGVDTWSVGPLGPDDMARIHGLGGGLPPESFSVGEKSDPTITVLAVLDCIADLLPREHRPGGSANRPWVDMGHSDVSQHRTDLRSATVSRRTTLQMRLVPAGGASLSGVGGAKDRAGEVTSDEMTIWLFVRTSTNEGIPVSASDMWSGTQHLGASVEHDLLFLLRRAADVWAPLGRLLDETAPSRLTLAAHEVDELLDDMVDELASEGIEVMVPADMVRSITTTPRVRISPEAGSAPDGSTSSGLFTVDSICDISWSAITGGRELSRQEIDRLLAERHRLVRLEDGWILLDAETVERLRAARSTDARTAIRLILDGAEGLRLVPPLDEPEPEPAVHRPPTPRIDPAISAFITSLLGAMTDSTFPAPRGLATDLRPYQRAGLAWLSRLFRAGFGGILADDMGLGKTIQMIALHLWAMNDPSLGVRRINPTLVVAPTGLLDNWDREFARWAPSIRRHSFHGQHRSLSKVRGGAVVFTSYGVLRRDVAAINELEWDLVIADEAQAFKNPRSGTARAVSSISSGVRFALTGTPVENHLGELWSLFEWTSPGLLGSLPSFTEDIASPIERRADPDARRRLKTLTAPFMLRRTKTDGRIAPDLPPRTITDHDFEGTVEQATLYVEATDRLLKEIQGSTGMARRGSILKLLTELKTITNHPAQYLGQSGPLRGRSTKFDLTMTMVDEIVESGQSLVIFTQYVQMGKLLVSGLVSHGHQVEMLHGGVGTTERSAMVDRFQQRRFPVLVVSLRAGGTGLNLTAATHVIHYDRWWNPAVENQASDRVWRIGQNLPVQVHRLITRGTIEERIARLIESKQDLADTTMTSSAWFTELDDDHFAELVLLQPTTSTNEDDGRPPGTEGRRP